MSVHSADSEIQRLILVVDDQQDHLQLIERALIDDAYRCQIVTLSTTAEAIDFLRSRGKYTQSQRPDIVLMDLQLKDGQAHTILTEIKTDPGLRQIPIIILTPNAHDNDILSSYQQQCNSFVIKPQDLDHLGTILQTIKSFWLNLVTLPAK